MNLNKKFEEIYGNDKFLLTVTIESEGVELQAVDDYGNTQRRWAGFGDNMLYTLTWLVTEMAEMLQRRTNLSEAQLNARRAAKRAEELQRFWEQDNEGS